MSRRQDNRVALENDGARLEIADKVTGRAKYTTDYYLDRMLWAGYIRCPYGSAKLVASDVDAARAEPGVLEVEIAREEGRYPGDRIGHVCAESREAFRAALRALKPKWDISRPRVSLDAEKTPLDQLDASAETAQLDVVFAASQTLQEQVYDTQVQTHCCLEPHIAVVDYRGDHAVAWGSTQGTFSFRDELAEPLGLTPDRIEFHCEHVGGGFGSKFGMGAEGSLAAQMSRKYGRPCRVELTRKEEHLDAGMRPGSKQYMKVGANAEGKITAARVHTWGSVGFAGSGGGVSNPSRYDFGEVSKTHEDVHLNSQFPRAMRAPGHPQGMFAVEMMMDDLARAAGMDPLEFRLVNDPNENRRAMLKAGAELIGWSERLPDGAAPGPIKRGLGVGVADWGNSPGNATVQVNVYRNGAVEVLSGAQDIGTGFRTMLGDCVAETLGVPRDRLAVKVGVSSYPPGPASGGSVTSRFTAPKALGAGRKARAVVVELAAKEWGISPEGISIEDGVVSDGQRSMTWEQACKLLPDSHVSVSVSEDGEFWKPPTGSEAVQYARVAVDVETGIVRVERIVAIQEVGLPVNRNTVENQITGGVIQGLSFALFEERVLNRANGAMVNPNMDQYKIAGTVDIPEILPVIWKSRDDAAVNSLGEPPVIPTAGAIACAVANAIGVPVRSLPITPDRVLAALADA